MVTVMGKADSERMLNKEQLIKEIRELCGDVISFEKVRALCNILEICDDCGHAWKDCTCT
jgi:hypothetical protein